MLVVIKDLISEKLNLQINDFSEISFIGDTWHDEDAAKLAGFSFVHANDLHKISKK